MNHSFKKKKVVSKIEDLVMQQKQLHLVQLDWLNTKCPTSKPQQKSVFKNQYS